MKYSLKLCLLLLVSQISVLYCQKSCQTFVVYEQDSTNLEIPSLAECQISKQETWQMVLHQIILNGTLSIIGQESIQLRYDQLIFGSQGLLQVFNQINSFTQILFEQKKMDCEQEQKGFLDITSDQYNNVLNFEESSLKNNNQIKIKQPLQNLKEGDKILIIDPKQNFYSKQFNITQVNQQEIVIDGEKNQDFIVVEQDLLSDIEVNPYIIPIPITTGIIFKKQNYFIIQYNLLIYSFYSLLFKLHSQKLNQFKIQIQLFVQNSACLSATIRRLEGVNFINPQVLRIKEGVVNNCVFYGENSESENNLSNQKKIEINSEIINSSFIKLQNITFNLNHEYNVMNNTFYQVKNIEISQFKNFTFHKFIQSSLQITPNCYPQIRIFGSEFYQSDLIIDNNTKNSIILQLSKFSSNSLLLITKDIAQLEISNCQLLNTQLDLSTIYIQEYIKFDNNYIYNSIHSKLVIIKEDNIPFYHDFIFINNTIIGHFDHFLYQIKKIKQQQISYRSINLTMENNFIRVDKNQKGEFFSMQKNTFKFNNDEDSLIFPIKSYNQDLFYLYQPDLKFQNSNLFYSKVFPTYCRIENIVFMEENIVSYQIKIIINNNKPYIQNGDDSIQIFSHRINYISFIDSVTNEQLTPISFDILFFQKHSYSLFPAINQIKFDISTRAILNTSIKKYKQNDQTLFEEIQIEKEVFDNSLTSNLIAFKKSAYRNRITIQWRNLDQKIVKYQINISYCKQYEYLNRLQCVQQCDDFIQDFICVENCGNGFFEQINSTTKTCQKCKNGCAQCTNQEDCSQCSLNHSNQNNNCLDSCLQGYFPKFEYDIKSFKFEFKCIPCQSNCFACYNQHTCLNYIAKDSKTCLDQSYCYNTEKQCIYLSDGYLNEFGQCFKMKN